MRPTGRDDRAGRTRAVWTFVLRLLIGAAAIAFLLARTDLAALSDVLGRLGLASFAVAASLMIAVLFVSAFRWSIFLRRLGLRLRSSTLQRMYFVGTFFNAFLPTGVGGDAYKAMRLRSAGAKLSEAVASVLLDRMAAVAALAFIGLGASVLLLGEERHGALVAATATSSAMVVLLVATVVVAGDRLLRPRSGRDHGIRARLWRAARAVRHAAGSPRALRDAIALGLAAQVLTIAAHASLADALDLAVPVATLAAGVTLATFLAALPISINGIGVREAGWVWVLETQGVTTEPATGYAFLVLGIYLMSSAVGGVVYLVRGGTVAEAALRRSEDAGAPTEAEGAPGTSG